MKKVCIEYNNKLDPKLKTFEAFRIAHTEDKKVM